MSAASASAAGAAATGNQPQNQLLGSGPMGAGLNLYGPNLTQTPGFFHNLLTNPGDTMQQINNNPGGMYGTGSSNVGANAAIAQGDPNNVTAEGFSYSNASKSTKATVVNVVYFATKRVSYIYYFYIFLSFTYCIRFPF